MTFRIKKKLFKVLRIYSLWITGRKTRACTKNSIFCECSFRFDHLLNATRNGDNGAFYRSLVLIHLLPMPWWWPKQTSALSGHVFSPWPNLDRISVEYYWQIRNRDIVASSTLHSFPGTMRRRPSCINKISPSENQLRRDGIKRLVTLTYWSVFMFPSTMYKV